MSRSRSGRQGPEHPSAEVATSTPPSPGPASQSDRYSERNNASPVASKRNKVKSKANDNTVRMIDSSTSIAQSARKHTVTPHPNPYQEHRPNLNEEIISIGTHSRVAPKTGSRRHEQADDEVLELRSVGSRSAASGDAQVRHLSLSSAAIIPREHNKAFFSKDYLPKPTPHELAQAHARSAARKKKNPLPIDPCIPRSPYAQSNHWRDNIPEEEEQPGIVRREWNRAKENPIKYGFNTIVESCVTGGSIAAERFGDASSAANSRPRGLAGATP